jgi:hypothetical protein
MNHITLKLQELAKSRKSSKLLYKQSKLNRASYFVDDLSDK